MKWLPEALDDMQRLHLFLHKKNPSAAARAMQAILESSKILESNSGVGRLAPNKLDWREWFISFGAGAYVLRYKLQGDVPIIIRVWHSKESRN